MQIDIIWTLVCCCFLSCGRSFRWKTLNFIPWLRQLSTQNPAHVAYQTVQQLLTFKMTSWPSGNFHSWRHKGLEKAGRVFQRKLPHLDSHFSLVGFQRVTSLHSHRCCCACVVCNWKFTENPEQATSCRTNHFLFLADNKSKHTFANLLSYKTDFYVIIMQQPEPGKKTRRGRCMGQAWW